MTGLEIYLLVSPLVLLGLAGAATWLFVGRKNAPLGSKANKVSLPPPAAYPAPSGTFSIRYGSAPAPRQDPLSSSSAFEAPRARH